MGIIPIKIDVINDQRQTVTFLFSDPSGIVRKWSASTTRIDDTELKAFLDSKLASYVSGAVAHEQQSGLSLIYTMEEHLAKINADVNSYIFSHYDVGTILIFLANSIDSEVERENLRPVMAWVKSEVMAYYYTKKAEIEQSGEWAFVTWDFNQFDATDPKMTII